jgi:hypothetical protein
MLLVDLNAGEGAADELADPPAGVAGAAELASPPSPSAARMNVTAGENRVRIRLPIHWACCAYGNRAKQSRSDLSKASK